MTNTTAVLLAAGAGTRLGLGPRALLPFRGTTLVAHAAGELLRAGCSDVVVVIGAGADDVETVPLPEGCRFVVNPRWQEGVGSSFAAGIAAALDIQASPDPLRAFPPGGSPKPEGRAIVVALVDQPGLDAPLVAMLLTKHRPGRITAAGYRSRHGVGDAASGGTVQGEQTTESALRRGNPVVFSPDLAAGAAAMASGDSAAREYLAAHPELVDVVDLSRFTDGADVDTPEDLHLLHHRGK